MGLRKNRGGWVERAVLRAMLAAGLVMAVGLWFGTRGAGEGASLWLPALVGLAVAGGVRSIGRARARGRWEAAWDAYASDEYDVAAFRPVEESAEPCLAGGR